MSRIPDIEVQDYKRLLDIAVPMYVEKATKDKEFRKNLMSDVESLRKDEFRCSVAEHAILRKMVEKIVEATKESGRETENEAFEPLR